MNCEKAWELMNIKLYGEDIGDQEKILKDHLASCEKCREYEGKIIAVDFLLRDWGACRIIEESLANDTTEDHSIRAELLDRKKSKDNQIVTAKNIRIKEITQTKKFPAIVKQLRRTPRLFPESVAHRADSHRPKYLSPQETKKAQGIDSVTGQFVDDSVRLHQTKKEKIISKKCFTTPEMTTQFFMLKEAVQTFTNKNPYPISAQDYATYYVEIFRKKQVECITSIQELQYIFPFSSLIEELTEALFKGTQYIEDLIKNLMILLLRMQKYICPCLVSLEERDEECDIKYPAGFIARLRNQEDDSEISRSLYLQLETKNLFMYDDAEFSDNFKLKGIVINELNKLLTKEDRNFLDSYGTTTFQKTLSNRRELESAYPGLIKKYIRRGFREFEIGITFGEVKENIHIYPKKSVSEHGVCRVGSAFYDTFSVEPEGYYYYEKEFEKEWVLSLKNKRVLIQMLQDLCETLGEEDQIVKIINRFEKIKNKYCFKMSLIEEEISEIFQHFAEMVEKETPTNLAKVSLNPSEIEEINRLKEALYEDIHKEGETSKVITESREVNIIKKKIEVENFKYA